MSPSTQLDLPVRSVRRSLDRYDTPVEATRALLARVPELRGARLIDPCSGSGSMAALIGAQFTSIHTNDIDRTAPADTHFDASGPEYWRWHKQTFGTADWIVTNPPFSEAGLIVTRALDYAPQIGVAMLLRITFAEACGATRHSPGTGREWLAARPWTHMHVLPRLKFAGRGTDSATVAWFVWLTGVASQNSTMTRADLSTLAQADEPR